MRIGFLGPAGTYADEALHHARPEGGFEAVPLPTIYESVMAVHDRSVDLALAPIENSLEGGVAATLDALSGEAGDVRIVGEVVRPIHHCLVAGGELSLRDVEQVLSHPQATAQCGHFLRERLPDAERVATPSTADAVRAVAEGAAGRAALGSAYAAGLYGAQVLVENVEDEVENVTRFVWLAPEGSEPLGPPDKTSIVFWGFNDESPGALVDLLAELAGRDINLSKIESRPGRVQLGHYKFFADLEAADSEERVRQALDAIAGRVDTLKVLGSYPAAAA